MGLEDFPSLTGAPILGIIKIVFRTPNCGLFPTGGDDTDGGAGIFLGRARREDSPQGTLPRRVLTTLRAQQLLADWLYQGIRT